MQENHVKIIFLICFLSIRIFLITFVAEKC